MSTPKSEVTNTFLSLIEDRDLCVDLTDEEITGILDYYLNDSTYLRFKNCTKDLTDNEPYDFHTDTFTADGNTNTFTLTKYPTNPNSEAITYICTVGGEDVFYTFDENTLIFTLDETPANGSEVVIGYNFYGQFNETLDNEEIWILAWGMIVAFRQKILNNHNNMKNKMSSKDYNVFSPANLLDKLNILSKEAHIQIRNLRVSYSFGNDFTGFTPRDT